MTYELTGPCPTSGAVAGLAVVIPDTTCDGAQFTPAAALQACVSAAEGPLPSPVLQRFIRFVEASGDIVVAEPTATVTGDLSLSFNSWCFASRIFEVTSYHDDEHDGWCYELYEVEPTHTSNDYIEVRVPDLQPAGGPFVPAPVREVTLAGHGSPRLPWPIFRHLLDAISASGDIIADQEGLMA